MMLHDPFTEWTRGAWRVLVASVTHSWTPYFRYVFYIVSSRTLNDQPRLYSDLFQLLEDKIVTFVKSELKKTRSLLTYPDSHAEEDEDEEQSWSCREAFLEIALHFLRKAKQEELADCLRSSKAPITSR